MARSIWKGPFVEGYVLKKAEKEKTAYQMRFIKFLGKSLSSIEGDIRKFTNEKNRLEKAFPNLEKEISKLSNELKDKDVQDAREKSELFRAEINDINEEIKALEQEIEEPVKPERPTPAKPDKPPPPAPP